MNALFEMLRAEVQGSLSREGKGGMLAPFRIGDGSVTAPSFSFTQETGSGMYRAGAGDIRLARLGADVFKATAAGLGAVVWGALTATSAILRGAVADGSSAVGVILDNAVTLANAGAKLLSVRNNGTEKFYLDANGGVHVTAGAGQVYATGLRSLEDLQATIVGSPVDGGTAVGAAIDTESTLANATAKLLSVRNGGVEAFYVDKDGKIGGGSKGQQISNSSGSYTNATSVIGDVTNLSVTITTTGRPVMLMCQGNTSGGGITITSAAGATSTFGQLIYRRDSTDLYAADYAIQAANGAGTIAYKVPPSAFAYVDAVAAGTYTYKVRAQGTNANTTIGVTNVRLVAFEL
jgi:hypothetical protein